MILIADIVATESRRVGFDAGGMPVEGYQTEDGISVSGASPSQGYHVETVGTLTDFPLSVLDGIYPADVATMARSRADRVGNIDWKGSIVVAATSDSIYMLLHIENSSGGSVRRIISTSMDSHGRFAWVSKDGMVRMAGTIAGGRLNADW